MNKKYLFGLGFLFLILIIGNISAEIIVSEIMYNPPSYDYYGEFIEIYNNGTLEVDLSGWSLCGQSLSSGYIDHSDSSLNLNSSMILEGGKYALITDGGSGTYVYSNYSVSNESLNLHIGGSSMCTNGLTNSGDTIELKDDNNNLIAKIDYSNNAGADGDGNSLQFKEGWCSSIPTPGGSNNCPTPEANLNNNESVKENSSSNQQSITNETIIPSNESLDNSSVSQTISGNEVKNTVGQTNEKIVLDTKDIKSENGSKNLDKNNYLKYGLSLFAVLVILLLLFKRRKFENEFK